MLNIRSPISVTVSCARKLQPIPRVSKARVDDLPFREVYLRARRGAERDEDTMDAFDDADGLLTHPLRNASSV